MPKKDLSIIMPVYNINEELSLLTKNAINSLLNTIFGDTTWELIIIDNASSIGTDYLRQKADIYIRNNKNLGYAKAVNQGFLLSSGKIIAVSNNDVRVSNNWYLVTKEVFSENPRVGSVHYRMLGYNECKEHGRDVWLTGKEGYWSQSFFCWRREAIEDIGGICEDYILGSYDDYDWHYRMNQLKHWLSAYTNKTFYQHQDSSTKKYIMADQLEADKVNGELFKEKFGEYPEAMWEKLYPGIFSKSWKPFA